MFKDKNWCTIRASKDWCLTAVEILTGTSLDTKRSLKILSQVPNPFAAISPLASELKKFGDNSSVSFACFS